MQLTYSNKAYCVLHIVALNIVTIIYKQLTILFKTYAIGSD